MNYKNSLILGVSSGFGAATALEMAKKGYNIYGVHLDLGSMKIKAEELRKELEQFGTEIIFFNANAASVESRQDIIRTLKKIFSSREGDYIGSFLHSIAFGALGPFISQNRDKEITQAKLEMSQNVMANSLLFWVQDLFHEELLGENSRIFGMTSSGARQSTNQYGAVSAAKAILEVIIRQLAFELAPYKIQANAIQAGAANTPAASKIPDFDKMLKFAKDFNPNQRNTVPEDVAKVIALLSEPSAYWITGQTINVDGGQSIFTYLPEYF